jgi:hypothetical protein
VALEPDSGSKLWRLLLTALQLRGWLGLALVCMICVLAVVWFGVAWLNEGLPRGDLAGDAAKLTRWQGIIAEGQLLASWASDCFFGQPRGVMNLGSGLFLAYLPFLVFFEPLAALKVGTLIYLGLSGVSAFLLVGHLTPHKGLALVLGLIYALHPLHLSVAIDTSHANFPPFYFLAPLVTLGLLRLLKAPTGPRIAAFGALAAVTAWVDLPRAAVLAPGLAVLALGVLAYQAFRKWPTIRWQPATMGAGAIAGSGVLAGGLLSIVLVPALAEMGDGSFFSKGERQSSIEYFAIQNPFYYLDPAGAWLAPLYQVLPSELSHDAGTFFLTWGLLLMIGLAIWVPPRAHRRRMLLVLSLLAVVVCLASAHGPVSGFNAFQQIFDHVFLHESVRKKAGPLLLAAFLLVTAGIGLVVASSWLWKSNNGSRGAKAGWLILFIALPAAVLLTARPYAWVFESLPFYGSMRNPGWFATAMPPLGLVTAAALAGHAALRRWRQPLVRLLIIAGLLLIAAGEIMPYRDAFSKQLPAEAVADLRTIGQHMDDDERPVRFLVRESYNPHADLLHSFTDRASGFYWLNWMSPPRTKDLMLNQVYPKLQRDGDIEEALKIAGAGHVRYIVCDLEQGELAAPPKAAKEVWAGEHFALYENKHWQAFARLSDKLSSSAERKDEASGGEADDSPAQESNGIAVLRRPAPGRIVIETEKPAKGQLVVTESWSPNWTAKVNGTLREPESFQNAFISVDLPENEGTSHTVELTHERPMSYSVGLLLTGLSVVACLGLTFGQTRVRHWIPARSRGLGEGKRR